jgi:hypothetical protein
MTGEEQWQRAAMEANRLRTENERLRAALEEARKVAKTFWIDYPMSNIADADDLCGICEGISDAIATLEGNFK